MATSEAKVKASYPRAAKKKYQKQGGGSYFLIWTGFPESLSSMRLGSGKTAAEAWTNAASAIERAAKQPDAES